MNKIIISKPKKKKKKIIGKSAFFSFLFMAVVVIILGSYTRNTETDTVTNTQVSTKAENPNQDNIPITENAEEEIKTAEQENELISQIEEVFENQTDSSDRLSLPSPSPDEKQIISSISLPVTGNVMKSFSDSELIYSKTMADYRTHSGIDIKAEIGSDVLCPANGKISEISKDDNLGYTITIDHGNMVSKISNLSSKIDLKVGDKVSEKEKLAYVGDSAEFEIADEPHIHYELIINGVNVNPLDYIE